MKKYIAIIAVVIFSITACTKKDPEVVSKVVNVTYPAIDLKGSKITFIQKGASYIDSGAILTDDITGVKSNIQYNFNNVDSSTEGWYEVNYKASNANGFLTNVSRYVLVLDYTPSIDITGNIDLSGNYQRTSNGIMCNVVKLANGLFASDNMAGSSTIIPGYIIMTNDSTINVPAQSYNLITGPDEFDYDNEKLYQTSDPYAYSFVVLNGAFGTAVRKFVKQ